MPNKVLGSKKYQKGPQKMEKTDYLKNGPSYILPKINYVISEPYGNLLHWKLSCSLTFNFLVHQEGGDLCPPISKIFYINPYF